MLRALAMTLLIVVTVAPLAQADEKWPALPICWPAIQKKWWNEDSFEVQPLIKHFPPGVRIGQLFPGSGLFFETREDLDLFLGPRHALAEHARILPAGHPLVALEYIDTTDVGGRVHDLLFGDGFMMRALSSTQRIPEWGEASRPNKKLTKPFVRHSRRPLGPWRLRGGPCCLSQADFAPNIDPFRRFDQGD